LNAEAEITDAAVAGREDPAGFSAERRSFDPAVRSEGANAAPVGGERPAGFEIGRDFTA
jgi:hypothetical protein